jgi:hypothetical protein
MRTRLSDSRVGSVTENPCAIVPLSRKTRRSSFDGMWPRLISKAQNIRKILHTIHYS